MWAQLLLYPLHGPQVREEPLKHQMPPEYRNSSVTRGRREGERRGNQGWGGECRGSSVSFHYGLHSPPHLPVHCPLWDSRGHLHPLPSAFIPGLPHTQNGLSPWFFFSSSESHIEVLAWLPTRFRAEGLMLICSSGQC